MVILMFLWLVIAAGVVIGMSFASYRHQAQWQKKNGFVMPAFFAALPMSTGDFVWAKLVTATTRVLWLSIATLLACAWIGVRAGTFNGAFLTLQPVHGDFTAATVFPIPAVVVAVLFLLAGTANVMSLSLDGQPWSRVKLFHISRYALYMIAGATVGYYWGQHHVPPPGLADAIRIVAVVRLAALALLVYHAGTRGLLSWNRLTTIVLFWLTTVGSAVAAVVWLVPEERLSLPTAVAFLVLIAPVLGTASAPLALQLNRTR